MDNEKQKVIMLVEDDVNLALFMADRLRLEGFIVRTFSKAEDALRMLRTSRPALIILDILMPGMNGIEFLRNVEAITTSHIPIVVHSAVANAEETINYPNVDAVVPKGAEPSALIGIIKQILGMGFHMDPNAE